MPLLEHSIKSLNAVVKMPQRLVEASAEGYLSVRSFCGITSMEKMRADSRWVLNCS